MGRGIGMGWHGGKRLSQWISFIVALALLIALAIPIGFGLYQTVSLMKEQYDREKDSQAHK